MEAYKRRVFISYAWGTEREEIVNKLDQSLQQRGIKIIRDKRDVGYRDSIREFMERIGQGQCVIVVVSDKYLRSPNCMFELIELAENRQFYDRIFPIILSDANIYDPVKRLEYVKFWEAKRAELAEAMKTVDPANLQGIRDDMDNYDRFRDKISGLTSILKDMNTLTPEMHSDSDFEALFSAIESRLSQNDLTGETMAARDDQNKATDQALQSTDSPAGARPADPKGGVSFNHVGQITVAGDIVGGDKTEMYIAARDLFQGQLRNPQELVTELQKLRDALGEMAKRAEIDQEEVILASAQVDAAIRNAGKPDADPQKIIQRLSQAKEIIEKTTAGVGAAAGLVTAFNKAIELIQRLFM